jgi:DNA-binding LytR/AlgR family response regulator
MVETFKASAEGNTMGIEKRSVVSEGPYPEIELMPRARHPWSLEAAPKIGAIASKEVEVRAEALAGRHANGASPSLHGLVAVQTTGATTGTLLMLVGERQHRFYPLDPQKVDYIEADKNYVTLWMDGKEYISRDSIKRLSTVLAALGFVRIDRSFLLNIRAILYAQAAGRRSFAFTLRSGVCLHSSAAYRGTILRVLPLAPIAQHNVAAET